MKLKSKRGVILFIILITYILTSIQINSSPPILTLANHSSDNLFKEKIELDVFENLTTIQTNLNFNAIFSNIWESLVLNLTLQNLGDPLDAIFIDVITNHTHTEKKFATYKQIGLTKALVHQFEVQQSLYIPLNVSNKLNVKGEIRVSLEPVITWRSPNINLSITNAEIIGIDPPQPNFHSQLPFFAQKYEYLIELQDFSILEKKFATAGLLFVSIPEEMQLETTLTISLSQIDIDYVSINGINHFSEGTDFIRINHSFQKPLSNISSNAIPIHFLIMPDYTGLTGLIHIQVDISIAGVLTLIPESPFDNVLGSHPVPDWIMFPVLFISLFCIPYYKVYQEQVNGKEIKVFDTKKQKKL